MLSLLKSFYCLRNTSVMNHRSLFFFFKSVPEQGSGGSAFLNEKKKTLPILPMHHVLSGCLFFASGASKSPLSWRTCVAGG
jgi:hypothetical protein